MRYFAVVTYNGVNYDGWQSQPHHNTIEDNIEKILSQILNEEINIIGAGRTDKGVHALGQTFHFDYAKEINDLDKLTYSVNRLLPDDIKILKFSKVNDDMHARFSAKKKHYQYRLYLGKNIPFFYLTDEIVYQKIDLNMMIEASKLFLGEHNFQNYTSKEEDEKGFIRNIYSINIKQAQDEIIIDFIGNGFMKYMIRYIVGDLLFISQGKLTLEDIKNRLNSTRRCITNHKASPYGLYLINIYYD